MISHRKTVLIKNGLKIPNGYSKVVNGRTYNTMAKRKNQKNDKQ